MRDLRSQTTNNLKSMKNHLIKDVLFIVLAITVASLYFSIQNTNAAAITVCPSGCDYTNLTAASMDAGPGPFVITIEDDFVFDDTVEADDIFLQNDTTLQCEFSTTVFGDSAQDDALIWPGSTNIIQDCTFENVSFDTSGKTDVSFLRNTFSDAAASSLTFTTATDITIEDNVSIQKIQVQNANDFVVEDNTFKCLFGENCLNLTTAGGGPFDYSDSADVPSNLDFIDNTFSNHNVSTSGDWISVAAGIDIDFTGNTFESGVTVDDAYIVMVSVQNAETYFAHNYFLFPERDPGDTQGTWGLNIRRDVADTTVLAEHNTFILGGAESAAAGNSCMGFFDDETGSGEEIDITFNYNLCYNPFTTAAANAISFGYDTGSADLTFSDSYNGFFNFSNLISDDEGIYTSLNANTTEDDPVLRTENIATTDDNDPSPISRYFDVDGTLDIGAYEDVRETSYTIDDDCTVDYSTCYSNESSTLNKVIKSGDDVTFAAGTYDAVTLDSSVSGITVSGAGTSTIFDADDSGSAFVIENIDSSDFEDFQVQDTTGTITDTYEISHILLEYDSTIYDDSMPVTGIPDQAFVFSSATCDIVFVGADDTDVTTAVGPATDNWNIGLADFGGLKITAITPDRFVSSASEMVDYVLDECGSAITVDLFIEDVFTVSGGEFTYNGSAVTSAGASIKTGLTDPATLEKFTDVDEIAGFLIENSDSNTFTNITSTDNTFGFFFEGSSASNSIEDSTISSSGTADIVSQSTEDNTMIDTSFDRSNSLILTTGDVNVFYTVRASISDSSGAVDAADATFTSDDSLSTAMVTSDGTGFTPYTTALPAYDLTSSDITETSGGHNPYELLIESDDHSDKYITFTLNTPEQTVAAVLSKRSGGSSSQQFPGEFTITSDPDFCSPNRTIDLYIEGERIADVLISNDNLFTDAQWQPYTDAETPFVWQLSEGDGDKTIYVQTRSAFQNVSPIQTVDIMLDTDRHCMFFIKPEKPEEETDEEAKKAPEKGILIKSFEDTVYYYGLDGMRHVFPDRETYGSWFDSFDNVMRVTKETIANIPLGKNVTYKPGNLIKFSSPEVYIVTPDSNLRHIANEAVAFNLFGTNWNQLIKDISDVFRIDYTIDSPITDAESIDLEAIKDIGTIDKAQGFEGVLEFINLELLEDKPEPTDTSKKIEEAVNEDVLCEYNPFESNLSFGVFSDEVLRLQLALQCLGYFPDDVLANGNFGVTTIQSVRNFQVAQDIISTGNFGPITREALNQLISIE